MIKRAYRLLDIAREKAQQGDPRLFVEMLLKVRDKRQQELVEFTFKQTQEILYTAIFGGGRFLKEPLTRDVLKSRQVYASALVAYCLFAMRCCAPFKMFCGVPVENDDVHKQMLAYDNEAWLSLPTWAKQHLGIARGDTYKAGANEDAPGLYWNTEQHNIAFRNSDGTYGDSSSMVYRASTIRGAGTGGNYDVQWFTDAGKFNALTEEDFYISLRPASHPLTARIHEGSPLGKVHAETGKEKDFYRMYESMRSRPKPHERLLVIPWYLNPDYELDGTGEINPTEEESRVIGLIQQAQARFGLPDLTEDEIDRKIHWRRFEIEAYIQHASGAASRGIALFKQENLEDPQSCWNDPSFGTFDEAEIMRMEERVVEPTASDLHGLKTRIFFKPKTDDYYVSFMDVAGERSGGDLTSVKVMSCRNKEIVAAIEGNASDEQIARQHFDLMWRYNRGLICWENNGIGGPLERHFLGLCASAGLKPANHLYRRALNRYEKPEEKSYLDRPWGWTTTAQNKQNLLSHLQDDINSRELWVADQELIDHLRAFDPNNKRKHTADEVMSLMGSNEMRRRFEKRVPTRHEAVQSIQADETLARLKRQRSTRRPASAGFHLMGR